MSFPDKKNTFLGGTERQTSLSDRPTTSAVNN